MQVHPLTKEIIKNITLCYNVGTPSQIDLCVKDWLPCCEELEQLIEQQVAIHPEEVLEIVKIIKQRLELEDAKTND